MFLNGNKVQQTGKFSKIAVAILESYSVEYQSVDISNNVTLQSELIQFSGWHKFPQFYVNTEFIGGSYILPEFIRSGELDRMISKNGNAISHTLPFSNKYLYKNECIGHMAPIWRMKLSKNSRFLATASADGSIKLWDFMTGKLLNTLIGHNGWVNCVDISSNLQYVISGASDTSIRVWNLSDHSKKMILLGHGRWVNDIAISSDSKYLISVSADKMLHLWSLKQGKLIVSMKASEYCLWSVCILKDGSIATSAADGSVSIWEGSFTRKNHVVAHNNCVTTVIPDPFSNGFITASYDGTVKRWDKNGSIISELYGHQERIWSVDIDKKTQNLVSLSADNSMILWDNKGNKLKQVFFNDTPIACCINSSFDRIAIGHESGDLTWQCS